MKISTNGKRNITLDFNAPRNFRIVQNGVEIPYLRTGKNSFRLSKKVDGDIEIEEVKERAKRIKPFSLQSPQMTFISSDDVDRLNSAIEQMSLVNPQDVAAINNAAEKIDSSQMYIAEKQQQLEATQTYIDQQQQRLNETALGIQALETNNSQRLDGAENAILNLAGDIANTQNMAVEGMNTALNKTEEQRILLQAEIDTKADKDELETLRKDFEEKSDQFSNAMSNYSGGLAYDTLPQNGEAGQILAKRTDRQGDYIWIDQTPVIVKSKTIPTASEKYKGEVYQYVGETGDYTHGYIYECQEIDNNFVWVRLDVQPNTAVWGQITGILSDQTDLQDALNLKANKSYVDSQDNNLQQQIDAITAASDVTDIVGTYAQLQAYDTSTLPNNSIIKVLQDESRNDETTYYRWVITGGVGAWVLIGEEGPYYTKSETNTLLSAKQPTLISGTNIKTINGSSVLGSGDLSVTAQIAWGSITGTLSNQTDLQNALNAKQDVATAVNYDNISNCITEIPQDIKLELNNGTLTLKAGSKVYVPNGSGVFDTVTIANDTPLPTNWLGGTTTGFIYWRANENTQYYIPLDRCTSGTTAPTETNTRVWYDTNENKIKRYYNGSLHDSDLSLPIAIVTVNSSGAILSIDQVFNGFGYIGSTVFALPEVKGLIPNGRNADGSLKSKEFTTSSVVTRTFTTQTFEGYIGFKGTGFGISNITDTSYNEKENSVYTDTNKWDNALIGTCTLTSGKISNWNLKTPFHAVDYNDFDNLTINILKTIYPVGSCYVTIGNTNPNTILGVGTWTLVTSSVITSVNTNVPVKGNGKTLGLTNGSETGGLTRYSVYYGAGMSAYINLYDTNVGSSYSGNLMDASKSVGITTDANKSGIVGTVTRTATTIYIWQRTA